MKISEATHTIRTLALLLFVGLGPFATAQGPAVSRERAANCDSGSSRARRECEPAKVVVSVEQELSFSIEAPALSGPQCAATIEIQYTQRDALASVEGIISHADCAASSGEYKVTASVRDDKLELKTLDFVASWQRTDAEAVPFSADYPIGENVDLVRVRARETRCTCADAPAAPVAE
jgi:hypothetical protein